MISSFRYESLQGVSYRHSENDSSGIIAITLSQLKTANSTATIIAKNHASQSLTQSLHAAANSES